MATPKYPDELPIVSTYTMSPSAQALGSDNETGPRALRRRSRQPGATAQVTFRYIETDYRLFLEWWETELLFGHRWFWLQLPSAGGITWHVVRFAGRYTAVLEGHRLWTVRADLEIRDRRFDALDTNLVMTSFLYPVVAVDSVTVEVDLIGAGINDGYIEKLDLLPDLASATLTVTVAYATYSTVQEAVDLDAELVSGELVTTVAYLTYTMQPESIDLSSDLDSGSIATIVVPYTNWLVESVDATADLISGDLT